MTARSNTLPRARVLAIHRYYWPDAPPYASILRAIVGRWTASGHDVQVLTSQPSYKPELGLARRARGERVDGTEVKRISMRPDRTSSARRVFNMVYFPAAVLVRVLLSRRYDVVMCSTAPPVVLGSAVSLASRLRGAAFVYHCMDIHPEIGAISGEFRNPAVRWFLERLDRATCRRATRIVVLSEDMRQALLRRDPGLADRIEVINNFELPDYGERGSDIADELPSASVRIVFTGNIGRFQGLEELVEAVLGPDLALDGVQLVLMGEGAAKAGLQDQVSKANPGARQRVVFLPHGSVAAARELIRAADYGVVSLVPGVIRYAYPSKTATYLGEGTPVLTIVESDSELARFVKAEGVGLVADGGKVDTLRGLLNEVASGAGIGDDARERCLAAWRTHFSSDGQLRRWETLLCDVLDAEEAA